MFKNPFSFNGRISRTEYGLSFIVYIIAGLTVAHHFKNVRGNNGTVIFVLFYIPLFWFYLAQGAKRCHDLGVTGWWQVVPFYFLLLLFKDGALGENEYGLNAKGQTLNSEIKVSLDQEKADVFAQPDSSSKIIATLKKKEEFILYPNNDNNKTEWDCIKLSNNETGYIAANTRVIY